jgi:hypothetical protein
VQRATQITLRAGALREQVSGRYRPYAKPPARRRRRLTRKRQAARVIGRDLHVRSHANRATCARPLLISALVRTLLTQGCRGFQCVS